MKRSQLLFFFFVSLVSLNIIGYQFYTRFDITEDRIYTLTPETQKIISTLPQPITVKFFFSRSLKELPILTKTYASRVEGLLNEYATRSQHKITLEVIDPKPDSAAEELATQYGLTPGHLPSGESVFFGAVFLRGAKSSLIPLFDQRNEQFLEYEVSQAIVKLKNEKRIQLGILSNLPVLGSDTPFTLPGVTKPAWVFAAELRRRFDVVSVPSNTTEIDKALDILLVLHPKRLTEKTEYAIDQYLLNGGKVMAIVDPFSSLERRQRPEDPKYLEGRLPNVSSSLPNLFAAWGIEYEAERVIGDLTNASQVHTLSGVESISPFFLALNRENLNQNSPITKQLNHLLFIYSGAISKKQDSPYEFQPLIQSSKDATPIDSVLASVIQQQELAKQVKENGGHRYLAGLLEGTFETAFPKGPKEEESAFGGRLPLPRPGKAVAQKLAPGHLAKAKQVGRVLIVADTDFLVDENTSQKAMQGEHIVVKPINDNLRFLMNAAEILGGQDELIAIRGRGQIARPFLRVQALQKQAQLRWQKEEGLLSKRINELQTKLNELQSQKLQSNATALSPEQVAEVQKFRKEEAQAKARLREVRKILREDIEKLGTQLAFANLFFVPFGVSVFGFVFFRRRQQRARRRKLA